MLVLSRKVGERIQIGDDMQLVVLKSKGGRVQLGIDAPPSVPIRRQEILELDSHHDQQVDLRDSCAVSAA